MMWSSFRCASRIVDRADLRSAACLLAMASLAWGQDPVGEREIELAHTGQAHAVAPARVEIPRSYALVVGISQYPKLPATGQLKFAVDDATSVYNALIGVEAGQFPPENVHRLIGSQATLANLRRELEVWLPGVSKADDRVEIYFAGHGFVVDGKAYLAPYDIDPARVEATAYPMQQLGRVLGSKIAARWKALFTDACHSGAITPDADIPRLNSGMIEVDSTVFSLTASRDREQSFEGKGWGGGHGAFSYYLIEGLEGAADANGDGIVNADELFEYVRTNVRRETGGRQNPTADKGSFDPHMILAFNPTRSAPAPDQPPEFGSFVFESNMDGVEVFVDGISKGPVGRQSPLRLPGVVPGVHTIKAVRMGYEPDGPREVTIYPGQASTVTLRILIRTQRKQSAVQEFDRGLTDYQKGYARNYRSAARHFEKALSIDQRYSQAALYLGRSYNALFDSGKAKAAFVRAIGIDPDYAEAETSYGAMLLDLGDLDEAIRQLNASVRRDPDSSLTSSLLAQAFTRKGAISEAVRYARDSVRLNSANPEAHFWLAEALRVAKECAEAQREYTTYLRMSDFDSGLAGKIDYYVLGYLIGQGRKKRAAETDIWRELQVLANFGLCDCGRMTKDFDSAVRYCQRALALDNTDQVSHYELGVAYSEKFNRSRNVGFRTAAKQHFETVVTLNSQTVEADKARRYLADIARVERAEQFTQN